MTHAINRKDDAVSPVIGVMLMLVVTIIIAAVVSAFAGGLSDGTDKAPQASISGTFSQSTGLIMTHTGGDNLLTTDLQVMIRKSDEFGSAQSAIDVIVVDKSAIRTVDGTYWVGEHGVLNATSLSWQSGDSMFVVYDDLEASGISAGGYGDTTASVMDGRNIGKTIDLELYTKDGKMIATTSMTVQP
jgi:FlaG/FlaF family flagellin (archaellin)